jgi:hypothetical protein
LYSNFTVKWITYYYSYFLYNNIKELNLIKIAPDI